MDRRSDRGSAAPVVDAPPLELSALRAEIARLTEAVERRDEFIAILGHELRNPLAPLSLHVQTLQLQLDAGPALIPREQVQEELEKINRRVERFVGLLDRVFDVSRIGSGQLSLALEPVDLGAAVREWAASHEAELAAARCEASYRIAPGVIGRWDRARIGQILDNLLGNAMRYGAGRPIEVRVERDHAWALLTVRDHGVGIDPADHRRIFERYVRGDRGHRSAGLGVGLWVVDAICRALGGSVTVDSKLGCGATFVVRLPAA
jgi:signal transduction histidine kinase